MSVSLRIGELVIPSCCVLAPLAGISDLSYRLLNRDHGCRLAFVEMLSARSLEVASAVTRRLLAAHPDDRPLGVQLVGSQARYLLQAIDRLAGCGFDVIDLNAACPVRKVVRRGEGAALLQDPAGLQRLLAALVRHAPVPVTVKIRAGWDVPSINAAEIARRAADVGVAAIFVHGRTRSQLYSGHVDYGVISDTVRAVPVPVIGSGDVFTPQLARRMLERTGCAGVAVARGSFGNPWLCAHIDALVASGTAPERPGGAVIRDTMRAHLRLCAAVRGDAAGTVLFRKFFAWYTKGFKSIRPLRKAAFNARGVRQMEQVIDMLERLPQPDAAASGWFARTGQCLPASPPAE